MQSKPGCSKAIHQGNISAMNNGILTTL